MMVGNVSPARLSFTCARARGASARAAATASRGDFVMVRASSELEIDLRLEQGLRARREVRRVQGVGLEVRVVPVREQAPVGRQLIRHAGDIAGPLVDGTGLWVRDVDARDHRGLRLRELEDAEPAVHAALGGAELAVDK